MKRIPKIWLGVMVWIILGLMQMGCTTPQPPQIIQTALPLPVRPVLASISSAELTCLTDDVYARLAARNRLQRQYAEQLEVIIKSTQTFTSTSLSASTKGANKGLTPKEANKGLALSGAEGNE